MTKAVAVKMTINNNNNNSSNDNSGNNLQQQLPWPSHIFGSKLFATDGIRSPQQLF